MSKFTNLFDRPFELAADTIGPLDARVTGFINRSQIIGLNPKVTITLVGLFFVGVAGWMKFQSPHGLIFEYFFLFACAFVGWVGGVRAGFICGVPSIVLLILSELGEKGSLWILGVNIIVRVLAFGSVTWLAAAVGYSTRELQRTVEHRTVHLQHALTENKETTELLTEATEVFRQMTENITDVFWVTNPTKTQVEYVSPEFENLWGRSSTSLYVSPSTWIEGIHHEDRDRVTRAIFSQQVTGEYDEEYRVLRPDGTLRWVHDRAFPVRNEMGAIYRLVGIAEDITERKRTEQLLQAERDVGIALSSTSDLGFALGQLLDVAVQLEGIDCGGVYLADEEGGGLTLAAHRGLSGSFVARISHYQAGTAEARLAQLGRTLYMRQDQIPRNLEVLWGSEGLRALAVVPIQHQGILVGMLNMASYRQEEILPRTRMGIEMIASQVAAAIARIRAEDSLRRSETHLRTIVNSSPIALIATDAKGTITVEDGRAINSMGSRPGEHLRCKAVDVYADFPLIQENIRRGLAGEEFNSLLEFDSTVFECLYTPVRDQEGQIAGLIAVATDVTERCRLQREILEICDREQARIGQDIHDGLCQQLIGLAICANSLQSSLGADRRTEADMAAKICRLLDESITEARGVCQGLYPIRLSTEGLAPALEELAKETTKRHGLECAFDSGSARLHCDTPTATHLYRIAQEAINNAVKHSGGHKLELRLACEHDTIVLEVRDDGRWLNQKATRRSGMGRHIMDYRAELIGGTVRCDPGENGTVVICRVPRNVCPSRV